MTFSKVGLAKQQILTSLIPAGEMYLTPLFYYEFKNINTCISAHQHRIRGEDPFLVISYISPDPDHTET